MSQPISNGHRGKLLMVANTDWYLYNFRFNLLEAARSAGWDVEVACPNREYAPHLEAAGFPTHHVPFDTVGLNPRAELKALRSLARVIRRTQPTVIHLFTLKCVLYGCLVAPQGKDIRLVGAITGMGHLFTTQSWRTRILKRPVLLALKTALGRSRARLIFQNSADRDEFVAHRLISTDQTTVIRGSGVDCERFKPRQRVNEPQDKPLRLLFCGRLIAEKGIHEYLAAMARLREIGYTFESRIAGAPYPGNPSSLNNVEVERLKNEPGHIYLGQYDDMATLFANTDVVVLPTYREGTPKALLEAAASGCVIVATDIPGCHGLVEHGRNGALVPPREIEPLVLAVRKILDASTEDRCTMSMYSRKIAVEHFGDKHVNERTLAIYEASPARSI